MREEEEKGKVLSVVTAFKKDVLQQVFVCFTNLTDLILSIIKRRKLVQSGNDSRLLRTFYYLLTSPGSLSQINQTSAGETSGPRETVSGPGFYLWLPEP